MANAFDQFDNAPVAPVAEVPAQSGNVFDQFDVADISTPPDLPQDTGGKGLRAKYRNTIPNVAGDTALEGTWQAQDALRNLLEPLQANWQPEPTMAGNAVQAIKEFLGANGEAPNLAALRAGKVEMPTPALTPPDLPPIQGGDATSGPQPTTLSSNPAPTSQPEGAGAPTFPNFNPTSGAQTDIKDTQLAREHGPLVNLPQAQIAPTDSGMAAGGKAIYNSVAGLASGLTSADGLNMLLNPVVGVAGLGSIAVNMVQRYQNVKKTPPYSPERIQLASDVGILVGAPLGLHAIFKLGGGPKPEAAPTEAIRAQLGQSETRLPVGEGTAPESSGTMPEPIPAVSQGPPSIGRLVPASEIPTEGVHQRLFSSIKSRTADDIFKDIYENNKIVQDPNSSDQDFAAAAQHHKDLKAELAANFPEEQASLDRVAKQGQMYSAFAGTRLPVGDLPNAKTVSSPQRALETVSSRLVPSTLEQPVSSPVIRPDQALASEAVPHLVQPTVESRPSSDLTPAANESASGKAFSAPTTQDGWGKLVDTLQEQVKTEKKGENNVVPEQVKLAEQDVRIAKEAGKKGGWQPGHLQELKQAETRLEQVRNQSGEDESVTQVRLNQARDMYRNFDLYQNRSDLISPEYDAEISRLTGSKPNANPSQVSPESAGAPAQERIVSVAIRNKTNGNVVSGINHSEAFLKAHPDSIDHDEWSGIKNEVTSQYEKGFLTSNDRFVSPREAHDIAQKSSQVTSQGPGELAHSDLNPDVQVTNPTPARTGNEPAPETASPVLGQDIRPAQANAVPETGLAPGSAGTQAAVQERNIKRLNRPFVGSALSQGPDSITTTLRNGQELTLKGQNYLFPNWEEYPLVVTKPSGSKALGTKRGWTVWDKETKEPIAESSDIVGKPTSQQEAIQLARQRLNAIGKIKYDERRTAILRAEGYEPIGDIPGHRFVRGASGTVGSEHGISGTQVPEHGLRSVEPAPEPGTVARPVDSGAGEPQTTGIAQRVHEARFEAGKTGEILPGTGTGAETLVKQGQADVAAGVDITPALAKVDKGQAVDPIEMSRLRATHEQLSKATDAADQVQQQTPTPQAKAQYEAAFKAETDFARRIKPAATVASDVFRSLQGETDINTGTFTGLRRAVVEEKGRDIKPHEAPILDATARRVQAATKAEMAAKESYDNVVKQSVRGRRVRTPDELRAHFAERIRKLTPC